MSHREMEFEELLFYVVELKDKLNAKLDAQTAKINNQGTIINQQGQIVDELCWQLRELSEKMRELRVENRRLQDRLGRICPECAGCHCGTYTNHIADKYNEMVVDDGKRTKSQSDDKSVKSVDQGHPLQPELRRQTFTKIDGYTQVDKKREGTTKKKWLFGASDKKESLPQVTSSPVSVASSKTTWYIDDESIYEPIELSAKPTTRATLEKISAEVSSSAPKAAPRRLYTAPAMDNLAQYFGDDASLGDDIQLEEIEEEQDEVPYADVMLRPSNVKQFGPESQRGSSKVACSRIADLDLSYLPEEQSISSENLVRFTFSSRPATTLPTTTNDGSSSPKDNRRHAIRSYM
ncbi:uncharacterized protein LOC134215862 [Armigeres subalbatus]|uniref:uncharacterized protein LOC134215862 n=1 Tax=Armigeres subalbatus TaxID=124917 RepID=UPI002ED587E3